jgi:hypothetical protein
MKTSPLAFVACVLLASIPLAAHHAVQSEYDTNKRVMLNGTINKVEIINPHSYIVLDVEDRTGGVKTWELATAGPTVLRRMGLARKGTFKIGDPLVATGYPARNGSARAYALELTLSDGRKILLGRKAE